MWIVTETLTLLWRFSSFERSRSPASSPFYQLVYGKLNFTYSGVSSTPVTDGFCCDGVDLCLQELHLQFLWPDTELH